MHMRFYEIMGHKIRLSVIDMDMDGFQEQSDNEV